MIEFDKKRLKKLQNNEDWETLVRYYGHYLEKINEENVLGNSEFDTLKAVFIKEGKKLGIKEFFDNLDQQLYDN
jgi:retron-type reverse transcriptase